MKPTTIIFMGRSGCGKGTQARMVEEYIRDKDYHNLPILYLETGKSFREFIKGSSMASRNASVRVNNGERQPYFLAVWMWAHTLILTLEQKMHLLIDGTPRSLPEAQTLDDALTFYERTNIHVVYINVSKEWSLERMKSRARHDDVNISSVEERMRWFEHDVLPAIDFFRNDPRVKFFEVNGEQDVEKVHTDIMSQVYFEE